MAPSSQQTQMSPSSSVSRSFGGPSDGVRTGTVNQEAQIYTVRTTRSMTKKMQQASLEDSSPKQDSPKQSPPAQVAGADHHHHVYQAVYSGIPVYEMELHNVAVMRRRSDSWMNATQILKVAGIDKGRRTKIIEKEILTGKYEKVQGGYGRYQGTWIGYPRAREFCRQYGVEDSLRPLLDYDISGDGQGSTGKVDTPTKEQAMAANRKRLFNAGVENRVNGQAPRGTFFQSISPTASNALAAMSKAARFDSPMPRPGSSSQQRKRSNLVRTSSQQFQNSQDSAIGGSQGSMHSAGNESVVEINGHSDSTYATLKDAPEINYRSSEVHEPPRKRFRPSLSQENHGHLDPTLRESSPTEPNDSFLYTQHAQQSSQGPVSLPPLSVSGSKSTEQKRLVLIDLFSNSTRSDYAHNSVLAQMNGRDLDIPLDASANNALHWAATLGRVSLLRLLISKGANMYQGNAANQTPLMAAVQVSNSLDHGCFPEMLDVLGPLIDVRDALGRTVLHHIAVACGVKGRAQSSRYYLESLLEYTVRQGSSSQSNPSTQQNSFAGNINGNLSHRSRPMNLGRFMSEVVNVQDKSGNTALNLVARIGNRTIINQLEEVGADFEIANNTGFRPVDFGVYPRNNGGSQNSGHQRNGNSQGTELMSSQEAPASTPLEQIKEEIFASTFFSTQTPKFRCSTKKNHSNQFHPLASNLPMDRRNSPQTSHRRSAKQRTHRARAASRSPNREKRRSSQTPSGAHGAQAENR